MFTTRLNLIYLLLFLVFLNLKSMAQSNIQIENNMGKENFIYITNDFARPAAKILKTYLDKSFTNPFLIKKKNENDTPRKTSSIQLIVTNSKNKNEFYIRNQW